MNVFNLNEEIVKSDFNAEQVIEEMNKQAKVKSDISVEHFEESDNVPDPRDLNKNNKNLLIFDDLILSKQNKIEGYYTRGRRSNVYRIYLSQNYFKLLWRVRNPQSLNTSIFFQRGLFGE